MPPVSNHHGASTPTQTACLVRSGLQIAERTISDDLEYLIEKAVDPRTADYAVVTGVEIHNWAAELKDGGEPSMEFVAPTRAYVVVNGVRTNLDLMQIPVSHQQRVSRAQQQGAFGLAGGEGALSCRGVRFGGVGQGGGGGSCP